MYKSLQIPTDVVISKRTKMKTKIGKQNRIMVGCNILTSIDSIAYPNHCMLWYQFGRHLKSYNFLFNSPRRTSIDNMRNSTIKGALDNECDFIFFYDDDVIIPMQALEKLLKLMYKNKNVAVASGLTYVRKYPFPPMLFKTSGEGLESYADFEKYVNKDGVLRKDLGAVGFSCVLIRTESLKDMRPPYCITGSRNTEDVYLCLRIQEHNPKATIVCDTKVITSHLCDKFWVDSENVNRLRKFEKIVNGREPKKEDRGLQYAKNIKSRLRRQPRQTKGVSGSKSRRISK